MTMPGSSAPAEAIPLLARLRALPGASYWGAVGLVLASLGLRLLFAPILANGYGFLLFYPAVILSAYWLGGRPALLATALSAAMVCAFGPTPLSFLDDGRALLSLAFFLISSILLVHVLSSIRERFSDLAASHARVEALATGQAELFREHAQRTTDHLQLISAILQMRAYGEEDPMAAQVLNNAASRTLLISRTHRAFTGDETRTVEFEAFGRRLADVVARRGGLDADRVVFGASGVAVPVEQATALGLVLLEYLTTLTACEPQPRLLVLLEARENGRVLSLIASGAAGIPAPRDMALIEAMTEQLGGTLKVSRGPTGCDLRLAFPAALQPPPRWEPLNFSLH
ncbi:DUF4118 domain-containing protein [Brevundimonas sp. GCM10030266]|uniref:DUF4118 domain-containing protein n=1 Tax=Brevundimonas sp. GCM10030266 TaxID=3273386 RepID=UPI0036203FEE